ncbi:diguanylate phosphodiesterase [Trinickia dabaoshanensis]|uniref:Diguanylate phosphodiesterase n=2 Tax=Trinickia dabaoshanensis TaxID=564714 RepID=A0A2N7VAZ3_9BURK|nr:diguanylate phosphodiesterase [Trinickia dabaoshanensis]
MKAFNMNELPSPSSPSRGCSACRDGNALSMDIGFAFQPIVDMKRQKPFAFEALVRGANGEPASFVLSQIDEQNKYPFDQRCRQVAIASAAELQLDAHLSINFMPNAVYRPEACIRTTLRAAETHGFPLDKIIFETVEGEFIADRTHIVNVFRSYKEYGFLTAIDDFGSGYSGMALLVDFQPDIVKLDMFLLRNIDQNSVRQRIVKGILAIANDLGIRVIAEGIETKGERDFFLAEGVTLMQGYLFAKPAFRQLPNLDEASFA